MIAGLFTIDVPAPARTNARTEEHAASQSPACYHCGTLCRDATFMQADKAFCCHGCLTVFEILSANGLTDFYQLSATAGVRINAPAKRSGSSSWMNRRCASGWWISPTPG